MMPETNAEHFCREHSRLDEEFATFRNHCSQVAQLCYAEANDFFETYHTGAKGERKSFEIYDDTAPESLHSFTSLIESLLMPSNERWSRYQPTRHDLRRDKEIQRYYEDLTDAMFAMRYNPSAGFQAQMASSFMSLGAFGNSIIYTDGMPGGGLRYRNCFIGDVVFDVNHQGLVDQIYRRFDWSNQQVFEAVNQGMWKGGTLPEIVRKEIEAPKPLWEKRHEYIHVVVPNNQIIKDRHDFHGMPYASYYIHKESKTECYRRGYRTQPYAIGRYMVSPHEVMGRGPCMRVLNDIKSLNEMARDYLTITHKAADPPILLHDDGMLAAGSSEFNLLPGGENYGMVSRDGKPLALPFVSGAQPMWVKDAIQMKQDVVRRALLVDVFHRVSQKDARMTAQEALLRDREKSAEISPISARLNTEKINNILLRELDIAFEQHKRGVIRLPEMPAKLQDAIREDPSALEIDFIHESPITRLQKSEQLIGIERVKNMAVELAANGDTAALEMIDTKEMLLRTVEGSGAPWAIIKPDEVIAAEAQAKAHQAEMQQMQEMAPAMTQSALNIAKANELQGAF